MGQGVAGSTSLPQLSPGPLAQGLVLEILPRAGTVHLKTPPPSLFYLCRAGGGGRSAPLLPPVQKCVS